MKKLFITLAATAAILTAAPVQAEGIMVKDAYAYATPKTNAAAAIFMTVENHGDDDRMIGFETKAAARTELHTMEMDNEIMKMRKVDGYDAGMHETLTLDPMGNHIMVFDRIEDWNAGDTIDGTAVFDNAGEIPVTVQIIDRGAKPTSLDDDHHMNDNHH